LEKRPKKIRRFILNDIRGFISNNQYEFAKGIILLFPHAHPSNSQTAANKHKYLQIHPSATECPY
jgi:hypothetical protein